jgi:lysophospholipase L1-like esterase
LKRFFTFLCLAVIAIASDAATTKWVTSWAGAIQGPYPVGNPSAQPNLNLVFPKAESGARDQSFRMIVRPDVWGPSTRIRLSNALGTRPVTFDGVYVGLQLSGSQVMPGTNRPVRFGKAPSVTIPPGGSVWSDAVALSFVKDPAGLEGRKLAVSFHVVGESGPMTWHAKALTTSFATFPGVGARGHEESEAAFPAPVASWFFLDAVDMQMPSTTRLIVAFGDSITDGTASTMNGDDRWPDVLSRRLHTLYGQQVAVVNAGIGGNQVIGPPAYAPDKPFPGGPSALMRLERDVLSLSGVSAVIWLEGTNDFSKNGNAAAEPVIAGMKEGVARLRAKIPGVRVIGATVTSALGSTSAAHGFAEQDQKRKQLNEFIRASGTFDAVAEFDLATVDMTTGGLRAEFVPESTIGGAGDKLHPNRLGYQAMGASIDLKTLFAQPLMQVKAAVKK